MFQAPTQTSRRPGVQRFLLSASLCLSPSLSLSLSLSLVCVCVCVCFHCRMLYGDMFAYSTSGRIGFECKTHMIIRIRILYGSAFFGPAFSSFLV